MGTNPSADEIVQQRHIRAFSQRGGAKPNNVIRYAGADEQYAMFGDVANPRRGSITPIREHDLYTRNAYRLIGRTQASPDLQTVTATFKRKHGGVSWVTDDLTCPNNFYELAGDCGQPDSFLYGWSDFVAVYSNALATATTHKGRKSDVEDAAMMDDVELTLASYYEIGGLSFGENAQTLVEREVVDTVYASFVECGNCGLNNDGTSRLYAVTKSSGAGSPGIPAEVVWTIDGGASYSQTNITGLGGTTDPTGIEIFGNFVVVLDTTGNGYWVSELNRFTGAPLSWSNVTTGFTSSNQPNDMFVASSGLMFLCGQNGRIYKVTNALTGAEEIFTGGGADLIRISGDGNGTIVAVGESGVCIKSTNNGVTWSAIATPTSGTLRAVEVMDQYLFWIGSGTGGIWYTLNGGETWVQFSPTGVVRVDDIVFATEEVGYILAGAPNTTTARLYTTYNAGRDWSSTEVSTNPRLLSWLTFTRGNRLAVPRLVPDSVAARRVAVAGLSGGGTDGILIQGVQRTI